MNDLLSVETFNNGGVIVNTIFKKLYVDADTKEISIICKDVQSGAAGFWEKPFTMQATNNNRIPVFNVADEPIWVDDTLPEEERVQKTIGEFDMWLQLVFVNNMVSLNDAIEQGIMRTKGLINSPLKFIQAA